MPPDWQAQAQAATAINSAGVIVGNYVKDNAPHGFILNKGEYFPLDVPGAIGSMPYGISSAGIIVGIYASADMAVPGYVRIPKGRL